MLRAFFFIVAVSLASACAPADRELTRTQYAYRLLDQGKTAEAILLLEDELAAHPDNEEARVLLGSAMMGMAKVNIYSIIENFQDLVFTRSMRDSILDPKERKHGGKKVYQGLAEGSIAGTPVYEQLRKLDAVLNGTHLVTMYLNRFPQLLPEDWIYFEQALAELEKVTPSPDICLYRAFIRMVYLKNYLAQEILRDENLGERAWICAFSLRRIRPGVDFVDGQIQAIYRDMDLAVSLGAKRLVKIRNALSFLSDVTAYAYAGLEFESSASYTVGEKLIKDRFGCEP